MRGFCDFQAFVGFCASRASDVRGFGNFGALEVRISASRAFRGEDSNAFGASKMRGFHVFRVVM